MTEAYARKLKERHDYREGNFLCITCGKPLSEEEKGKYKNCAECRLRNKENRKNIQDMFLRRGICPKCREHPVMGNEKTCPECRAKIVSKPPTDYSRAWWRKYQNERNARNKANGICVVCRKEKADEGYVTCTKCRKKRASYHHKKREEWELLGLCTICGAERKEGYRVCEKHYKMITERAKKRKRADHTNHPWARTTRISSTDYKNLQ